MLKCKTNTYALIGSAHVLTQKGHLAFCWGQGSESRLTSDADIFEFNSALLP